MISLNDIISNVNNEFADRKIYFGLSEVPESIILPESWKSFGLSLDEAPTYPVEWHSYITEFPSVIALLNDSLLGTALLASEKVEMLYIFHDANGFYYYLGGLPIGG
ncbi:hypothetical protein [Pseudomonas sp. H9]|uniref:hypothetical protein n=1 Tax=Pseudomonas sp. H9 TaxID=483968 RepID=UPI0010582876|nr:hypothetical protein [Pseudomonas sp. H9]TDF81473.1 hypothetical protein E1573_16945 [Pseudomonas sp. H9]